MNCETSTTHVENTSSKHTVDWQRAHRELVSLSFKRARLDLEEAEWLLLGEQTRVHRHLGYRSYREYLSTVFGYSLREAKERLSVARDLSRLPRTKAALGEGALVWSGARELCRIATWETEEQWLQATKSKSVRQIEQMVSGLVTGDLPGAPKDPGKEMHVLRFEVTGDTYALWREAVKRVRAEHGGDLSEDDALLAIARMVLAGPKDEGRASYQVAVTVCQQCEQGFVEGAGKPVPVSHEIVEMACCDAQHIGVVKSPPHVGQPHDKQAPKRKRAKQSIPPALRREIRHRDDGCVVDGCGAAVFTDLHHLNWDDSDNRADNLICLCSAHHRHTHLGRLCIRGTPSTGLVFLHADGNPYGSRAVDAAPAKLTEEVFDALKNMGFAARDARDAVDAILFSNQELPAQSVGQAAALQQVLRMALSYLRS